MKKFSRILAALICFIMLLNSLTACGLFTSSTPSGDDEPKDPVDTDKDDDDKTEDGDDDKEQIKPEDTLYTILYKGGENASGTAPTAVRAKAGEEVTLSNNTFIKSGYTFVSWSDGEKSYAPGDKFTMPENNVTMTAQWKEDEREQVAISFNTLGGTSINTITAGKGEDTAIISLPQAYKEGYIFSEWFIDEALTKPFYSNILTLDAPLTLYAGYYEVNKKEAEYLGTGESSLTSQDPNTVIMIDSFGVELTQANYTEYIKVTNNYEIKETPNITIEQSGDMYLLKAAPAWPTGGNFYIETKSPVKIIIETDDGEGNAAELALSKLFFTIHVGENNLHVEEKSHIIYVQPNEYFAYTNDKLYLTKEFAFNKEIYDGKILKIFDKSGNYEYAKVGSTSSEAFGATNAFVVHTLSPSLNEIYNEFKLSYTEDNIKSSDYIDTVDEQEVENSLKNSEGFRQLQNMSAAIVADYAVAQGFANVAGVELLDGTMLMNEKSGAARSGHYNPIAVIYDQEYGIDKETGEIYGTWYVLMRGVDQKAKVHVAFGMDSNMWISADGDFDIDVDVNLPWDDKFVDVSADIWFDVYLGHSQSISFTFDIVYYNKGVEYDARDYFENHSIYDYPNNFAQKYKDLINMGNRDVPIFAIDLFIFKIDILQMINVKIPIGVELTMSVNGSFSVKTSSYSVKYYGIKGDINKGFESYSGETYCSTSTSIYYYGTFGVMAGVYLAVDLSIFNLGKLGSVGVEVGFGVYYDFYGYGYTTTSYKKESADTKWETDVTETSSTIERGGAFSEIGLYFKISIYAKSDIFKVKVEAEAVAKIPLVQKGDRYLLIGFTEEIEDYAKNGIVFGDEGFNIFDLGLHYYTYLDLREGDEVIRVCADIPENKSLTIENLARYGEFNIQSKGMIIVDNETGDIKIAERFINKRAETSIELFGHIGRGTLADKSNVFSITIPLIYVPDKFGLEEDKLGETIHVTFMVDDKVYHEMDIEYGYTLMMWNFKADPNITTEIDIMYSSRGVRDEFYAENPEYLNITWKTYDFNKVLKEDTVIEARFSEKLVQITYRYIEGISSNGAPVWTSEQTAVNRLTWLYDILPELSDPGENIRLKGNGTWSVANKQIDFSDETTVISADYEYLPVTLTVKVDAYETNFALVSEATYTYELNAGDTVYEYINKHMSTFYKSYAGLPYEYGVWWMAYIKEDVSTTTKIWQDTTYNIGWMEEKVLVSVQDRNGNTIASRSVKAFTDQSDIMEEDAVKNIEKSYVDENGATWVFKGWINDTILPRLTSSLVVIPIYEKDIHIVKLDPNGGRFDYATAGSDGCFYWEIVSGDSFSTIENYHRVLRDSTETESYTFNGWYYLGENGEKIFEFAPVLENITYYADWRVSERTWDINLYANSSEQDGIIEGTFEGGTNILNFKKNNADTKAIINAIKSGDYSILPTPTANESHYTFVKWTIVEFVGRSYELYPIYQNNGTATIIVEVGNGKMYRNENEYLTGQFTMTMRDGQYWALSGWNGWKPAVMSGEIPYALNEETGEFEWLLNACYEDEYYLYTFKEWQTSDGNTAWTFEAGQVVTITAVYERHYKRLTTRFSVDLEAEDHENIDDGIDYGAGKVFSYRDIYSAYGDTLDPSTFPIATKTIANDPYGESVWEYVFDHWECVETGATVVDLTVTGNREYKAVFRKEYIKLDVTFDAGENAIFPSTGERYYTMTVNKGTIFGDIWGMVETPVRTDNSKLYTFLEWGRLAETSSVVSDEISPALYWNTEHNCYEGDEDMIQIILDTGNDDYVFEHSGTRYYTVMFELGTVLVDSMYWEDNLADNEWPVGYLCNFVIMIDGEAYIGFYDIELPFDMTIENNRTFTTATSFMKYDEYREMLNAQYSNS